MKNKLYGTLAFCLIFAFLCCANVNEQRLWRYSYLGDLHQTIQTLPQYCAQDQYFLVVLVDARHLDYSSPYRYLSTLSASFITERAPDPGHAWIVLSGYKDGKPWIFEGGHSVNCNSLMGAYIRDVTGLLQTQSDPNPVRHLFRVTEKGFFEYGSGENRPTFAAAIPLTKDGFDRICKLFDSDGYDFSQWGVRGPNCVQFALSCLATIGIELECYDVLPLPPSLSFLGKELPLWSDPQYASLALKTPDLLEKRLWELVKRGTALCATSWYSNFRYICEQGYVETDEVPSHPKPHTATHDAE